MDLSGISIATVLDLINKIFKGKESPDVIRLKEYIISIEASKIALDKENSQLRTEKAELMKQIAEHNKWQKEKELYETHRLETGTWVYRLKGTDQKFCPRCFVEFHVPIHLQPHTYSHEHINYCPKCDNKFEITKFLWNSPDRSIPEDSY